MGGSYVTYLQSHSKTKLQLLVILQGQIFSILQIVELKLIHFSKLCGNLNTPLSTWHSFNCTSYHISKSCPGGKKVAVRIL